MTLKELADVAGVSDSTVRRTAKELFPDKFKNGVRTIFNEHQSMKIMNVVTKKNMVAMQNDKLPLQTAEPIAVDYEAIGKMIGMAVSAALSPVVDRLDKMSVAQLPAPIKEDYYSLVGYCSIKGITVERSSLALHGRELKKIAIEKSMEIHQIPDERWGKVNSYPVEILDDYFYGV